MKHKLYPPTQDVEELFNLEWRRAKKILIPLLDRKKKPKLYMANSLGKYGGLHYGSDGILALKIGKRWVKNSHAIVLRKTNDWEFLKKIIRHEICHVTHKTKKSGSKWIHHPPEFKSTLYWLEKEREIEESQYGIKKEPSPEFLLIV